MEDEENSMLMKFVADIKLEVLPTPINIAKLKGKLERLELLRRKI